MLLLSPQCGVNGRGWRRRRNLETGWHGHRSTVVLRIDVVVQLLMLVSWRHDDLRLSLISRLVWWYSEPSVFLDKSGLAPLDHDEYRCDPFSCQGRAQVLAAPYPPEEVFQPWTSGEYGPARFECCDMLAYIHTDNKCDEDKPFQNLRSVSMSNLSSVLISPGMLSLLLMIFSSVANIVATSQSTCYSRRFSRGEWLKKECG
jgi:hypothetical protein